VAPAEAELVDRHLRLRATPRVPLVALDDLSLSGGEVYVRGITTRWGMIARVVNSSDLDQRRRKRFDVLDGLLDGVAVETLEQVEAILIQATGRHAEVVGKLDNNAAPLLGSLSALVRDTLLGRVGVPNSRQLLVGAVHEHLNVMTPGALERVRDLLVGVAAHYNRGSGSERNEVLTVLRGLAGIVSSDLQAQLERAAVLEAQLGEFLSDEPDVGT